MIKWTAPSENLSSSMRVWLNVWEELCTQGTFLIIVQLEKRFKLKNVNKKVKTYFRIIPKAHAHLQTMTKTYVKFQSTLEVLRTKYTHFYSIGAREMNMLNMQKKKKKKKKIRTILKAH